MAKKTQGLVNNDNHIRSHVSKSHLVWFTTKLPDQAEVDIVYQAVMMIARIKNICFKPDYLIDDPDLCIGPQSKLYLIIPCFAGAISGIRNSSRIDCLAESPLAKNLKHSELENA